MSVSSPSGTTTASSPAPARRMTGLSSLAQVFRRKRTSEPKSTAAAATAATTAGPIQADVSPNQKGNEGSEGCSVMVDGVLECEKVAAATFTEPRSSSSSTGVPSNSAAPNTPSSSHHAHAASSSLFGDAKGQPSSDLSPSKLSSGGRESVSSHTAATTANTGATNNTAVTKAPNNPMAALSAICSPPGNFALASAYTSAADTPASPTSSLISSAPPSISGAMDPASPTHLATSSSLRQSTPNSSRCSTPDPSSPACSAPPSKSPSLRRRALGELSLTLAFNKFNEQLVVSSVCAKGLPAHTGSGDIHARLYMLSEGPKSRRKTGSIRRSAPAEWSDTLPPFRMRAAAMKDEILCVQLIANDSGDDQPLAEAFIPLGSLTLGAQPRTTSHPLHQAQDRRKSNWRTRISRSTSLKKRSMSGPGSEAEETSALLSWLTEQSMATEEDEVVARLVAYRDQPYSNFPNMLGLHGRASAFAESMWELFTSECAHLGTLEVLINHFLHLLTLATSVVKENRDARVPAVFQDIDHVKLLGNVAELHAVSLQFALEFETLLLSGGRPRPLNPLSSVPEESDSCSEGAATKIPSAPTSPLALIPPNSPTLSPHSLPPPGTWEHSPRSEGATARPSMISELEVETESEAMDRKMGEALIKTLRTMKAALFPPELQYRLQHQRARKYLNTLLQDNEMFYFFIEWCEEDSRCCRMNFKDLQIQPLQRLTRYPLLLKAIAKESTLPTLRTNLQALIREFEREIEQQNARVSQRETAEVLRRVELSVVWPSAAQVNTTSYMPETLRSQLSETPHVNLRSTVHRLQRRASHTPLGIYEGWLTTVQRSGRAGERLYAYLLDDVLLMTQPCRTGSVSSADAFEPRRVVEGPWHLSELQVHDVPDDAKITDALVIVILDGFGSARTFFTLRADSAFEKADWMRSLSGGIARSTEELRAHEASSWDRLASSSVKRELCGSGRARNESDRVKRNSGPKSGTNSAGGSMTRRGTESGSAHGSSPAAGNSSITNGGINPILATGSHSNSNINITCTAPSSPSAASGHGTPPNGGSSQNRRQRLSHTRRLFGLDSPYGSFCRSPPVGVVGEEEGASEEEGEGSATRTSANRDSLDTSLTGSAVPLLVLSPPRASRSMIPPVSVSSMPSSPSPARPSGEESLPELLVAQLQYSPRSSGGAVSPYHERCSDADPLAPLSPRSSETRFLEQIRPSYPISPVADMILGGAPVFNLAAAQGEMEGHVDHASKSGPGAATSATAMFSSPSSWTAEHANSANTTHCTTSSTSATDNSDQPTTLTHPTAADSSKSPIGSPASVFARAVVRQQLSTSVSPNTITRHSPAPESTSSPRSPDPTSSHRASMCQSHGNGSDETLMSSSASTGTMLSHRENGAARQSISTVVGAPSSSNYIPPSAEHVQGSSHVQNSNSSSDDSGNNKLSGATVADAIIRELVGEELSVRMLPRESTPASLSSGVPSVAGSRRNSRRCSVPAIVTRSSQLHVFSPRTSRECISPSRIPVSRRSSVLEGTSVSHVPTFEISHIPTYSSNTSPSAPAPISSTTIATIPSSSAAVAGSTSILTSPVAPSSSSGGPSPTQFISEDSHSSNASAVSPTVRSICARRISSQNLNRSSSTNV